MQQELQVKIKKIHTKAFMPERSTAHSAGFDLRAVSINHDTNERYIEYGTGLSFEIPEGHVGLLFQRSSVSKMDLQLRNAVGVLDCDFRGEVTFRFGNSTFPADSVCPVLMNAVESILEQETKYDEIYEDATKELEGIKAKLKRYEIGDKIGQLIILPYPKVSFVEAEELTETERGTGGYGSSGR